MIDGQADRQRYSIKAKKSGSANTTHLTVRQGLTTRLRLTANPHPPPSAP